MSVDINNQVYKSKTPLIWACEAGNYNIVDMLIKNKVDVNLALRSDKSPIIIAITVVLIL